MFENPRRGRQARNFTTNVSKILDLKSSSEQIFFGKLSLGAPVLMKTIKKIPKSLFGQPDGFSLLTGTKFAVRLIELPFTLQHDREIVMFRFYFPFIDIH